MISCENGKLPYSFFILLTQWDKFLPPKLTDFHIFVISLPLNMRLFSKSPYLTAHIKIMKQIALEDFLKKKHIGVSRTNATAKMELFVVLVSSFQPLTNFKKKSNKPQYYNVFWDLCITVACNFFKYDPFHRLMNYLNSSSDCICISYPII